MGVRITVNEAALQRLLTSPDGEVARAVRRVAENTANIARATAPVDNGQLRSSIRVEMRYGDGQVKAWVYTPLEYGLHLHEGTGVYGPTGQPIRPRRGQYLVFPSRSGRGGRGGMVFAREVRGVRPRRFLLNALRAASPWPVTGNVIYR